MTGRHIRCKFWKAGKILKQHLGSGTRKPPNRKDQSSSLGNTCSLIGREYTLELRPGNIITASETSGKTHVKTAGTMGRVMRGRPLLAIRSILGSHWWCTRIWEPIRHTFGRSLPQDMTVPRLDICLIVDFHGIFSIHLSLLLDQV